MKRIGSWTRKEFEELPHRKWGEAIGEIDTLIILPLRSHHDSGYRNMDFIAVKEDEPICRLSGCSDVIHIEGIGGYGKNWLDKYGTCPKLVSPTEWNIDCLPTSGLLRLFNRGKIGVGPALSSFEIYTVETDKTKCQSA